jgi:hypothetical protein
VAKPLTKLNAGQTTNALPEPQAKPSDYTTPLLCQALAKSKRWPNYTHALPEPLTKPSDLTTPLRCVQAKSARSAASIRCEAQAKALWLNPLTKPLAPNIRCEVQATTL